MRPRLPLCIVTSFACLLAAGLATPCALGLGASVLAEGTLEVVGRFEGPRETSRAPLAVARELVYLGSGDRVLSVDVSDPSRPQQLGESVALSGGTSSIGPIPTEVIGLGLDGDLLVAVVRPAAIALLDTSDPVAMTVMGTWTLDLGHRMHTLDGPIAVRDRVVHLAGLGGVYYRGYADWGLVTLDVRDPSSVAVAAVTPLGVDYGWGIGGIALDGDMAWLGLFMPGNMWETGEGGVQAWDVSDGSRPALRFEYAEAQYGDADHPPPMYEVHGAAAERGLVALAMEHPDSGPPPVPKDQLGCGGVWLGSIASGKLLSAGKWSASESATAVALAGTRLIVGLGPPGATSGSKQSGGVAVLDVARTSGPVVTARESLSTAVQQLATQGDLVFATGADGSLTILRSSPPTGSERCVPRAFLPSAQTR